MAIETTITNKILNYLNNLPNCIAEKVLGGSIGKKGKSDINGCWQGRALKIEVKTADHGNNTSLAQEIYLEKWASAGALCIVAYSLEDVKRIIKE